MNTPPKIKRHSIKYDPKRTIPEGGYAQTISDPKIGAHLAPIIADFVVLEADMQPILNILLGLSPDDYSAGYVIRAIKSPRGRIDLMRDLLELAPNNQNRSSEFDEIIAEFDSINGQRNKYIHGEWFTHEQTGVTYISEFDDHGLGLMAAREVDETELKAFRIRISALKTKIFFLVEREIKTATTQPKEQPR